MGNLKITYTDKVALTDDPTIPRENKATDDDFNELKSIINNNAENFNAGATIDNDADLFLNISKNLFNPSSCIAGGYSDSGWVVSTNYITVQYIKVQPNTKYTVSQFTNTFTTKYTALRIIDFDINHNFIRRSNAISNYNGTTITTNNDAYFIAFSFYTNQTANVSDLTQGQLEKGETATSYEPYIVPTIYSGGNPILFSGEQNFSLEEQRIGTWIDGKPLYRKTFILDPNIASSATSGSLYPSLTNINTCLLDINNSYWTDSVGNGFYYPLCVFHATQTFQVGFFPSVSAGVPRVDIRKGTGFGIARVVLTLRYTKTTD